MSTPLHEQGSRVGADADPLFVNGFFADKTRISGLAAQPHPVDDLAIGSLIDGTIESVKDYGYISPHWFGGQHLPYQVNACRLYNTQAVTWSVAGVILFNFLAIIMEMEVDPVRRSQPPHGPRLRAMPDGCLRRAADGLKHSQNRILKLKLSHAALAALLEACACKHGGGGSKGRVQWDPARDLFSAEPKGREPRKMLRERAIQIEGCLAVRNMACGDAQHLAALLEAMVAKDRVAIAIVSRGAADAGAAMRRRLRGAEVKAYLLEKIRLSHQAPGGSRGQGQPSSSGGAPPH